MRYIINLLHCDVPRGVCSDRSVGCAWLRVYSAYDGMTNKKSDHVLDLMRCYLKKLFADSEFDRTHYILSKRNLRDNIDGDCVFLAAV